MKAAELLAMYDRVADAPDAVEKLRRFVLELAVRGKLVSQTPSEGSAIDLLGQIARLREQQQEADAVRRRSPLPAVQPEDAPYSLPATWCWVRFGNIVAFSAGRTPSRNEPVFWDRGEYPWVSIADMQDGETLLTTREKISQRASNAVFGSDPVPPGTLLMSFKLTIGKIVRLGVPAYHNEAIISIRPHLPDLDEFLFRVLPLRAREGDTKGAIKGATLNRESITNILIPLPPLAEQQRIVAKVDELMALCDQLEAARKEREAARDRLAAASLARLNAPDPDTFQADARFALNVLPALSARPDQVKQLRQTILNLAVRGKLVPQDPQDEHGDATLSRIVAAKRAFEAIEVGRVRNELGYKPSLAIAPEIPVSWATAAFDDLFLIISGVTKGQRIHEDEALEVPYLRVANVQRGFLDLSVVKRIAVRTSDGLRYALRTGDVLMTEGGDRDKLGRAAVWRGEIELCIHQNHVFRVRPPSADILSEWVVTYVNSPPGRSFFESSSKQTTNLASINLTQLRSCPLPLPPIKEQRRIVEKVNELMVLCDQLEESISTGESARSRLLEAVLHAALDSEHVTAEVTAATFASSATRPQQKTKSLHA